MALFLGVVLSQPARWLLGQPPFLSLGRLSFSLYLVHFPLLFTVGCVGFPLLAAALPYSLAVAGTFATPEDLA